MSYRIQITVDEHLNDTIQARAKQLKLSISSYTRLILMNVLTKKNKLLDQAMKDIEFGRVEALTLKEFNRQLERL